MNATQSATVPATVKADRSAGRPSKLTAEEMIVIARLTAAGRSCRAIASILSTPDRSVSASTVATWQRRAKQPAEEIRMALAAHRMDAVESWGLAMRRGARDGRHAPSKDLLAATGVITPDNRDRLVLIIGSGAVELGTLPDMPERPAVIDVTPNPAHLDSVPALPAAAPIVVPDI